MTAKFRKLKEQLDNLERGDKLAESRLSRRRPRLAGKGLSAPKWLRYLLFSSFIAVFVLYAGVKYVTVPSNPVSEFVTWVNQPDEDLLQGMGSWMEEMGYTGLDREDLIELREQGVTATYTSRLRDLGYSDITLEQVVSLAQNDASSRFVAMMIELGYELSVDELVRLRQHDVTAYYTSNLHDLGYTDITPEELIRLKDTGVTTGEVEKLVQERESLPSVEELIRYHISNQ